MKTKGRFAAFLLSLACAGAAVAAPGEAPEGQRLDVSRLDAVVGQQLDLARIAQEDESRGRGEPQRFAIPERVARPPPGPSPPPTTKKSPKWLPRASSSAPTSNLLRADTPSRPWA